VVRISPKHPSEVFVAITAMPAEGSGALAAAIRQTAERYGVTYVQTPNDRLADLITRLTSDRVELDEVEQMLIALQRAGHLGRAELVRLQAKYLREARR